MIRSIRLFALIAAVLVAAQTGSAQESKAAKATREKLKQVIDEIDLKEVGTKAFFEDVNRELEKSINFKIDNTTGVSNNTKISYKGKKITVEKLLNDVSDKFEFGWVVISNPDNNKVDGWIVIRRTLKGKERGYEAGKEPKEKSSSAAPIHNEVATESVLQRWMTETFPVALTVAIHEKK
jgi:hypothetical protein